jgi:DNA-binding beta-propeller fold protein YncE
MHRGACPFDRSNGIDCAAVHVAFTRSRSLCFSPAMTAFHRAIVLLRMLLLVAVVSQGACGPGSSARDADPRADAVPTSDAGFQPSSDTGPRSDAAAEAGDALAADVRDEDSGRAEQDAAPAGDDAGQSSLMLVFDPLPSRIESGELISPPVRVSIRDRAGAVVTTSSATIVLSLEAHASGARLRGTLSAAAQSGVATFSDLSVDRTAGNLTMLAEATEISASGRSAAFDSVLGAATKLTFVSQPRNGTVRTPFTAVVALTNSVDEVVTTSSAAIDVRLLPLLTGATLSGARTVRATRGRAAFLLSIDLDGQDHVLEASSAGLASTVSLPFNIARLGASDGLGHLVGELFATDQFGPQDFPNERSFAEPWGVAVDTVGHRLFVSNTRGQRVMVFQLSANDDFVGVDRHADGFIAPSNDGSFFPYALAYDRTTGLLFVSQRSLGGRILVFDLNQPGGAQNPRFVFGQGQGATATGRASGLAIDEVGRRLFVADADGRVLVFNLNNLQNGMSASNVLGRPDFQSIGRAATTQALTTSPEAVAFDGTRNWLYVGDVDRVLVFDTSSIVDGENAIYVLGASDFVSRPAANWAFDAATIGDPIIGLALDAVRQRLYVGGRAERALVFDVSNIRNGMNATAVLGRRDFVSGPAFYEIGAYGGPVTMRSILDRPATSGTFEARIRAEASCRLMTILDANACGRNDIQIDVEGRVVSTISACGTSGAVSVVRSPDVVVPHRWYHVARTWTSTTHRLFIDGVLVAEAGKASTTINSGGLYLLVGMRHEDGVLLGESFAGRTAEVRAWTVARTAAEIVANMARPVAPGPTLLGYWKLDERSGVVATDSSGNNHPGSLTQGAGFVQTASVSRARIKAPRGMAFDETNEWLWVVDGGAHRVMSFDTRQLANGMNATDGLGHLDHGEMNYERSNFGDLPSRVGLDSPTDVVIDPVRHRAFVADAGNNRVLVFQLSSSHDFSGYDRVADFVLGQLTFETNEERANASGMSLPSALAYDAARDHLYVADTRNSRVLVFDTSAITNGQAAFAIIGQPSICARSTGIGPDRLNYPSGLDLDETTGFLYVVDRINGRVLVFDTTTVTTGMQARYVLGAPDFTTRPSETLSARTFGAPWDVAVDAPNGWLYVAGTNRVLAFDLSNLASYASASYVLGSSSFTQVPFESGCDASTLYEDNGVIADPAGQRLFVFESERGVVFDTSALMNGMPAVNVLGYRDFECNGRGLGAERVQRPQSGIFDPVSHSLFLADRAHYRILIIPVP